MWFKKNHHLTVLANPQFLHWRQFGQNRNIKIQINYKDVAPLVLFPVIQHSLFYIHYSTFIIHHSTIRQLDVSTIDSSTVRQFDIHQFDISTFIISYFRKLTALPQIKSSVLDKYILANYVAMWLCGSKKITI